MYESKEIVLAHLTLTQRRAYVLADNKLALNAGWDLEMLSLETGELGEAGFDLSLTGFDEFELGELFAGLWQDPQRCGVCSRPGHPSPPPMPAMSWSKAAWTRVSPQSSSVHNRLVFLLYQKGRDSPIFQAQDRAIDDFR